MERDAEVPVLTSAPELPAGAKRHQYFWVADANTSDRATRDSLVVTRARYTADCCVSIVGEGPGAGRRAHLNVEGLPR